MQRWLSGNGPLGYAEIDNFAIGSARVALAIAQNKGVVSIVGGGDTADFILKWDGHDGANLPMFPPVAELAWP